MTTDNHYLEAKSFLDTLFSRYFAEHDGKVELRCRVYEGNVTSLFYHKAEFTETDWAAVRELNKTHHIGVGVNPRPLSEKKKKEDIRDIICLWADVDAKDFTTDGEYSPEGKEAAWASVKAFPITPSIIVDTGHGYHLYWVLEKPLIGLNDEGMFLFEQVLAGVVGALHGDKQRIERSSCLRLPGTINNKLEEKGLEPVECHTISLTDKVYPIDGFLMYRDESHKKFRPLSKEDWNFGMEGSPIVRSDSADQAVEDIEKFNLKSSVKRHIITGAVRTEPGVGHTRSERDWLIIKELIFADYSYATIRSIFLNPFLKCSNRVLEKGETKLRADVERAYAAVRGRKAPGTPQSQAILQIRSMKITPEEKRQAINEYIVEDLLTGPSPAGRGFQDVMSKTLYYFDNVKKAPWDLESRDFYYFIQERYNIPDGEYENRKNWVGTHITNHCLPVTVHRVAHWDAERGVLYLSNHNNQILRLDGNGIKLLDNGEEGVFFHFDPRLMPFQFDETKLAAAVNYFETLTPERDVPWGKIWEGISVGLNLNTFYQSSLLNQYLISRAKFAPPDAENPVNEGQQRLLLILYFFSLFFESLMKHKPITCFLGLMHSGKSTTATAIGKVLFGGSFTGGTIPHDARSLKQVIGEHYYYEIDNLDDKVPNDICDVLAGASTGAGSEERMLGENKGSIFIDPHCFVVITSREPKFKRPDVVDRLLVFRMGKIEEDKVKSPTWMERTLLEHRDAIMDEVIVNLNSIVWILNWWRDWEREQGPDYEPPGNIFRIADYEEFGKKVTALPARLQFRWALEALMSEKAIMTVDEDLCYQTIAYIAKDMDEGVRELSLQELFVKMKRAAEMMSMTGFGEKNGKYPTAQSVAIHLPHILGAIAERLYVDIKSKGTGGNRRKFYTFLRLDQCPITLPAAVANLLDLDPGQEHDPQLVLERILAVDPGANVTKEMVIQAFGRRREK